MKKLNYYFTLLLVAFITLFSFFNMFQIVSLSNNVIKIVINNLLPFFNHLNICWITTKKRDKVYR